MQRPKHATGKLSRSIVPSAVLSTQPGVWRALPPPFVQKGTTRRPRAFAQQRRPCVNRHRHSSHQPSAKQSSRLSREQERPLTSQLLSGNGTQAQHSRRAKRLTMRCRTEKRGASSWNERIRDETTFAVRLFVLDKRPENDLAFLHFACGSIAFSAA